MHRWTQTLARRLGRVQAAMPMSRAKDMRAVKKLALKGAKPPRMSLDEKRLVRELHFEQQRAPADIARTLGRSPSSVTRLLAQTRAPNPVGRPGKLSEGQKDKLVALLEKMVDEADANHEVTLQMLMRRGRVKACPRVVQNALHERGYWFRDLREKPVLTPGDVKDRYAWAKKYKGKSSSWWRRTVHVHLDNHYFKVATTAKGRRLLAKRRVRGVYRLRKRALRSAHIKPNPKLRLAVGAKGFLIGGGVGGGKVLVWHHIVGRWGGDAAAAFYEEAVAPAWKGHFPGKRSHCILEDNDPTGNTSTKGLAAKAATKLEVFHIPKHSPDLNVMDFAIWSEIERRMRLQERKWPVSRRETRDQFGRRLGRTARSLTASYIDKSVGDLKRRCDLLHAAKGGLFEEGGRRRRPL